MPMILPRFVSMHPRSSINRGKRMVCYLVFLSCTWGTTGERYSVNHPECLGEPILYNPVDMCSWVFLASPRAKRLQKPNKLVQRCTKYILKDALSIQEQWPPGSHDLLGDHHWPSFVHSWWRIVDCPPKKGRYSWNSLKTNQCKVSK